MAEQALKKCFAISPISIALALNFLTFAPAQARETKTVILLESMGAAPIQCGGLGTLDSKRTQECMETSESESKDLRGEVFVEMRLDPNCAGMAFANNFTDVGSFGEYKEIDYINASVTYFPLTNERSWWLNILNINGKAGPDYMGGIASSAKEIAHKLCYIIHQEKITRR